VGSALGFAPTPSGRLSLLILESGDLYVTSERVLLVASGTTTLNLSKILDVAVDADSKILALTVDGRKTPYLLQIQEPFIAAAHIDRVSAEV